MARAESSAGMVSWLLFKPQPLISPVQVETSMAIPAPHHNYAVAGGMYNAFALGPVGAEDDFWLVALEPPQQGPGASRPRLSANILDAFGRRLLTLDEGAATYNPRGCAVGATDGSYRVTGPDGRELLRVDTVWVKALGYHVSYFHCRLKDRTGVVRMESQGSADAPSAMLHGPAAYGIRAGGTFARNDGLRTEYVARVMEMAGLRGR
jgi:hypothetical protein